MNESLERFSKLVGKKIAHETGPFVIILFFNGLSPFFMARDSNFEIKFIKALEYMVIE